MIYNRWDKPLDLNRWRHEQAKALDSAAWHVVHQRM